MESTEACTFCCDCEMALEVGLGVGGCQSFIWCRVHYVCIQMK